MKWNKTTASKCRYSENAQVVFGDAEIIWEESEGGYQGSVAILGKRPNGEFFFYEYDYGSCSGCDTWERAEMDDAQIEDEMRRGQAVFHSLDSLERFCAHSESMSSALSVMNKAARITDALEKK